MILAAEPADVDRRPAAVRRHDLGGSRSRLLAGPLGEGHARQRQLSFNAATGVNNPFGNRALLPYPQYGIMSMIPHNTRSGYHGLQTSFTKRMNQHWQASGTYTLSWFKDASNQPFLRARDRAVQVAPDLGNEYTLADTDQRHRFVVSGIWEVGKASGERASLLRRRHTERDDIRRRPARHRRRRQRGCVPTERSSRATTTSSPQNKTDVRLQQRIPLGNRVGIDLIGEAFNVFNWPNWGITTRRAARTT